MRSKHIVSFVAIVAAAVAAASAPRLAAQQLESWKKSEQLRFYPDDPIWHDGDMRDIPPVASFDLSKSYEFLSETFSDTVRSHGAALNANTLGEVPNSSWFTNRIGLH